jgi:hypothetical protein
MFSFFFFFFFINGKGQGGLRLLTVLTTGGQSNIFQTTGWQMSHGQTTGGLTVIIIFSFLFLNHFFSLSLSLSLSHLLWLKANAMNGLCTVCIDFYQH